LKLIKTFINFNHELSIIFFLLLLNPHITNLNYFLIIFLIIFKIMYINLKNNKNKLFHTLFLLSYVLFKYILVLYFILKTFFLIYLFKMFYLYYSKLIYSLIFKPIYINIYLFLLLVNKYILLNFHHLLKNLLYFFNICDLLNLPFILLFYMKYLILYSIFYIYC
jgi:hypothetical protein